MNSLSTTLTTITSAAAQQLLDAAARHSLARGNASAIAVVGTAGNLVGFLAMNGSAAPSSQVAQDKAYAAAGFSSPSEDWLTQGQEFGDAGAAIATAAVNRLVPLPGGVPIVVNGTVIGAVGVSGGTAAEDKLVADAAIDDVLGKAAETVPAAVSGYFAALRNNDPDAFAACFAEGSIGHDPVGAPPLEGPAAVRTMLADFLPSWGRFNGITEDEIFQSGNSIAVRWTGSGISPAGNPVVWTGINTYFLDDTGLIKTLYATFDAPSMSAQLTD